MDRFLALNVFVTVIEKGSFVRAAEALDLSPAAVTGHVQALERHLNTKLLNRTTRRLSLTDEGAAYVEHCRGILASMEEADAMLTSQRVSPKGMLRVMAPSLLCTQVLMPAMPAFLRKYPDMSVELQLSAAPPDFLHQRLDLCLQVTLDPDPNLVFRPLGLVRIKTSASPAYLKRRGKPKTIADLEHHDIIGVRGPNVFLNTMKFEVDGKCVAIQPKSRLIADSGEAQRSGALCHCGIMQGAEYAVRDLLESKRLVPVLEDFDWCGPPLGAVHPPNRFLSPKVQVFIDHAKELLRGRIEPYRADWDNR